MVTLERLFLSFNLIAHLLSHGEISPQAIIQSLTHPDRTTLQQTVPPLSDELDKISDSRLNPDLAHMCYLDSFTVEGGSHPSFPIDSALPTFIPCSTHVTADGVEVHIEPAHYAVTDDTKTHIYAGLTPPDIETGKQSLFLASLYNQTDATDGGDLQQDLCMSGDVVMRALLTGTLEGPDPSKVMNNDRARAACFDALGSTTTFLTTTPAGKTVKVTFGGSPDNRSNFLLFPVEYDAEGRQVINIGGELVSLSNLSHNLVTAMHERYPDHDFDYLLAMASGGVTLPPLPEAAPAYTPPTPAPTMAAPEFAVVPEPATSPDQSPPSLEPPAPEIIVPPAGELTLQMTFDPGEVAFEIADDPVMVERLTLAAQSYDPNSFNETLDIARIPQKRLFNFIPYGDPYLRSVQIEGGQLSLTVYKIAYNDPAGHTITIAGKTPDGRFVLMHFDLSDKYITSTPGTFQMYKKQNGQNLPYLTLTFATQNADHTEGGSTLPEDIQAYFEYIVNANEFMKSPTPIGYIVTPEVKGPISGVSTENEAEQILATRTMIPYVSGYAYTAGDYDRDPHLIPVVIPTGAKVAIKKWVYNEALNTWGVEVVLNRLDVTQLGFQILQSNVDATGTTIPEIDRPYITFWIPDINLAMINPPIIEAPASQSAVTPTRTVTQGASYFHSTTDPLAATVAAGVPHPGQVLKTTIIPAPIEVAVHRILYDLARELPRDSGQTWIAAQKTRAHHSRHA